MNEYTTHDSADSIEDNKCDPDYKPDKEEMDHIIDIKSVLLIQPNSVNSSNKLADCAVYNIDNSIDVKDEPLRIKTEADMPDPNQTENDDIDRSLVCIHGENTWLQCDTCHKQFIRDSELINATKKPVANIDSQCRSIKGCDLQSQTKTIMFKIFEYFKKEKKEGRWDTPNLYVSLAEAMGISKSSLQRIVKEGNSLSEEESFSSPRKKVSRKSPVL